MYTERLVKVGIIALTMQLLGCGESEVSFSSEVLPIFNEHCIECHDRGGEGIVASGFSVQDYDNVMKGTDLGPVVVPGSAISSTLYLVVAQKTARKSICRRIIVRPGPKVAEFHCRKIRLRSFRPGSIRARITTSRIHSPARATPRSLCSQHDSLVFVV